MTQSPAATAPPARQWPFVGGVMADLIKAHDWQHHSLGEPCHWPAVLRGALNIMLSSETQMVVFSGPSLIAFYNDAYAPSIGNKHPAALGACAADIWPELWDDLEPLLMGVWTTGQTFSAKDRLFQIDRHGYMEDVYFDVSYSALHDDDGVICGLTCMVSETTERVRATQALLASQARLQFEKSFSQLLLDGSSEGIYAVDQHGATTLCNATALRLLGYDTAAEMLGRSLHDTIHHTHVDGRPYLIDDCPINLAARSGQPATVSGEVFYKKDGSRLPVDYRVEPVWREGVLQGAVCIFVDTSARKKAEASLKASDARFRVLAQTLPNQIWMSDAHGQLTWFNQVVRDYCDLPDQALTGEQWAAQIHPDDIERVTAIWRDCIESRKNYEAELRVKRHDGVYRWFLSRAMPVQTEGEVYWLGANTDIDEQKQLEAGLSSKNALLEVQVDEGTRDRERMWRLSTDLILVVTTDGEVKAVNPAWTTVLGWTEAELVGTDGLALVHPDDVAHTVEEIARQRRGLSSRAFENRYRRRDGGYSAICWTAVPEGGLIHAVGRDITAERESQQALQQVEERLRQSQKMEALGQLTGGIAHDFNNLLQGISGSIEIVRSRIAEARYDDVGRFMDSATQSAHRAASLIHRLLAFARRQSLDNRAVDVNKLVVSMEDLLHRTLGEQIALKVTVGPQVWTARSDENQLESAILNLAINARDAMPAGGTLAIETLNASLDEHYVRAHEGLAAGDYAVVSVTDTGSGMTPAVLAKVFEPFFTTKPIGQGTGLGLSGIYGFVKQSGGHVRIHSQRGQGTTVRLYLPREDLAPAEPAALPTPAVPQGEGQTILVVEDDAAVRMVVLDELSELGYRTLEAPDGPSALPILASAQSIDLLLTDVGLPGMNGRQVAEIARQHRPALRVLFMTGYAEQAASRSSFLAPGMDIIAKPFVMDDLAARVSSILVEEKEKAAAYR